MVLVSGGPRGGGVLRRLEPSELPSGDWRMEEGKKCWIHAGTGNSACCFVEMLLVIRGRECRDCL